jgi:hypothetical protein
MIKLGIIGTAGRRAPDCILLNKEYMDWMADNVKCYIEHVMKTFRRIGLG